MPSISPNKQPQRRAFACRVIDEPFQIRRSRHRVPGDVVVDGDVHVLVASDLEAVRLLDLDIVRHPVRVAVP